MLTYFPVPYPDELFYSVVARYGVHTGQNGNQKAIIRDIFGCNSAVAIPDLPSHLGAFIKTVSPVWQTTLTNIITKNTLAPFYLPFIEQHKAQQILASMHSNQGGNIHTRCGIAASVIRQPKYFRYCPQCLIHQKERYGEAYWCRRHQLPAVDICCEHQCMLLNSRIHLHPKQKHLFFPAEKQIALRNSESAMCQECDIKLLDAVTKQLNLEHIPTFTLWQWTVFYRQLAESLDLKIGKRVDHQEIFRMVNHYYRYSQYNDIVGGSSNSQWLVSLFRKHRKSFHPMRHLAVWTALLPDSNIQEILEMVGGLPTKEKRIHKKEVANTSVVSPIKEEKRKKWQELATKLKSPSVSKLRRLKGGNSLYSWLYRNDKTWLGEHVPARQSASACKSKVDYTKWDEAIVDELNNRIEVLLKDAARPRLSVTFLIKQVSRSNSVMKHLRNLPQTNGWLDKHAESVEDFQIRRLHNALHELQAEGLPIKRWRLLRRAGIRKELMNNRIEEHIRDIETPRSEY